MSEWNRNPQPGKHLQSLPAYPNRREEFRPRHIYIALGSVLGIVATLVALIAHEKGSARSAADAAAVESTTSPIAAPAGTRPPTRTPVETSPRLAAAAGDGAWLIGKELKRGTYRTPGAGDACYWAMVSNLPGQLATVVSSAGDAGRQTITIGPNVRAFISYGCGQWKLIP